MKKMTTNQQGVELRNKLAISSFLCMSTFNGLIKRDGATFTAIPGGSARFEKTALGMIDIAVVMMNGEDESVHSFDGRNWREVWHKK